MPVSNIPSEPGAVSSAPSVTDKPKNNNESTVNRIFTFYRLERNPEMGTEVSGKEREEKEYIDIKGIKEKTSYLVPLKDAEITLIANEPQSDNPFMQSCRKVIQESFIVEEQNPNDSSPYGVLYASKKIGLNGEQNFGILPYFNRYPGSDIREDDSVIIHVKKTITPCLSPDEIQTLCQQHLTTIEKQKKEKLAQDKEKRDDYHYNSLKANTFAQRTLLSEQLSTIRTYLKGNHFSAEENARRAMAPIPSKLIPDT